MKMIVISLISIFLVLCVTACGTVQPAAPAESKAPSETTADEAAPTEAPKVNISIFVSDDSAEYFVKQEVAVEEINENTLFAVLISAGVIPEGTELLSFAQNGRALALDLSESYASYIRTLGTAGEYMALGCLVNSYLENFDADTVSITINGAVLETGHNIYDTPFGLFADNAA